MLLRHLYKGLARGSVAPRRVRRLSALLALALTGCTTGDPAGPPQQIQLGALTISIVGVPEGFHASITVTGGGVTRTVETPGTITGLTAGTYVITAATVDANGSIYLPSPATQSVSLAVGTTQSVPAISYALATGSMNVSFDGLPVGTAASILVSGPGGFSRSVNAPVNLAGLVPGTYTIEALRVQTGGFSYDAAVPNLTLVVAAVTSPSVASFSYEIATGALTVSVTGLPGGATGSVRVAGPNGYQNALTASATITDLAPGNYSVSGDPVVIGPDTWSAPQQLTVVVSASPVPVVANATYVIATGRLTVTATGQPAGSNPTFQVTGPASFLTSVSSGGTLTGLAPGTYTVSAPPVTTASATWAPAPVSQLVTVTASLTAAQAAVSYVIASGSLTVNIVGLPQVVQGSVTVTGPNEFQTTLSGSATLSNLVPGSYTVTGSNVTSGVHLYAPLAPTQNVSVAASQVPASATVTYALASGLLSITVSGLPGGTSAAITVTGPEEYQVAVPGSTTLTGLTPGSYLVSAAPVGSGAWVPSPANQTVVVNASTTAVPVTITYSQATGFLVVSISGLPFGLAASVNVSGPGGYSADLTASQTLTVPVGSFTITAQSVSQSGTTYTPSPASQEIAVTLGGSASVSVAYSGSVPGGLNLFIDGAYITQAVQSYANTVPLVSGRNALLRVFVRASESNSVQPSARVRFYSGLTLVNTMTIPAPSASAPLAVTEGSLNSSWNLMLDGSLLQPGLSMLVDVDPGGNVDESDETDNTWPTSGTAASLDIRTLSTLGVRLIPILQMVNGRSGNVSEANKATFLAPLQKLFPVASLDADVHLEYQTAVSELEPAGGNWTSLLSEMHALRVTEGSSRYYYGVVNVAYTSGVAGLGYIGLPASIGWDHLPSGSEVLAHELGHNFGRYHAPCGGPAGVDPAWPHATNPGAVISLYGYDIYTGLLKPPSQFDLMSYCDPAWITEYTYNAILAYRETHPDQSSARVAATGAGRSLLIWGRIASGQLVLEPVFEVDAPPSLPTGAGPNRIEGFGPAGQTLFSLPFSGVPVADAPDPNEQTFAFAVPLAMLQGMDLDRLRLTAPGGQLERRASGQSLAGETPTLSATSPGRVRVSWNSALRGALIRNARTGQVVSIARGDSVELPAGTDELDVVLSDGLRSVKSRVRPR